MGKGKTENTIQPTSNSAWLKNAKSTADYLDEVRESRINQLQSRNIPFLPKLKEPFLMRHGRKLAIGGGLTGMGLTTAGLLLNHKDKNTQDGAVHNSLNKSIAQRFYEQGLHYDLDEVKARMREWAGDAKDWLRGTFLPHAARAVTNVALGEVHTRLGLPPMTVGGEPLRRNTFRDEYKQFTNWQLQDIVNNLRAQLSGISDPEVVKKITEQITYLQTELSARKALSPFGG